MNKKYSFQSPIGNLTIYLEGQYIVCLRLEGQKINKFFTERFKGSEKLKKTKYNYHKKINNYLNGHEKDLSSLPIKIYGTEFQKKVWAATCEISYGQSKTYKEVASMLGKEKAYRAVGGALNKNPLPLLIPCHRVIGSSGKLLGFSGGLGLKSKLLKLESGFIDS